MKVKDRMTEDVVTVQADWPIKKAWQIMREQKLRHLPVLKGDELVGIITDRDLRLYATASSVLLSEKKYHDFLMETVPISQAMTKYPKTVTPDMDLREAAKMILDLKVGSLPVVRGNRLVGIIAETDLVQTLIDILPPDC